MTCESLIRKIHDSPTRLVLVTAGGGSGTIARLLETPGASRTVLEAQVPYSVESLAAFLGTTVSQSCVPRTARAMGMVAFQRCLQLTSSDGSIDPASGTLAGVACSASLASERPKRGAHRTHVAIQTVESTTTTSLVLNKGSRSRVEEEQLITRLILNQIADICGIEQRLDLSLFEGEQLQQSRSDGKPDWRKLLLGDIDASCEGTAAGEELTSDTIFPGAFNPLHAGHRKMADMAKWILGSTVEYEISVTNVEKPPLDYAEIRARIAQFPSQQVVWLTRAPTFVEKSAIFPQTTFVVGIDTIRRIAEPRYYGGQRQAFDKAIRQIADRGCRFLVFGRTGSQGFQTLFDIELPETLRGICQEVTEQQFRADISSTYIRQEAKSKPTRLEDELGWN